MDIVQTVHLDFHVSVKMGIQDQHAIKLPIIVYQILARVVEVVMTANKATFAIAMPATQDKIVNAASCELLRKKEEKLAISFNSTFRYIDDVLSLNNSKVGDYVERIYPIGIQIKDTTDTVKSASYLDLHLETDNEDCSPDPCNGNGICHNTQTGFTCSCHQGYTGQTCAAHCSPDPCNGRGACYNGKTDYYCQCQIEYTGRNCQTVSTTPAATTHISGLGSMPMLPSRLQQTVKEHHCNKLGLLMDLAVGKALHQQGAKGCGGNSADAVLIKHCQAPSFSGWRRGLQVINNCNQLNPYTPVGEWDSVRFTNNIGVMTSCQSGVIEMISQSCGSQLNLHNITSPAFNSVYTIDWT
ncbi:uncharacterized protein [Mytilus edulis]|uniref:uncharacterized protein n=1 Tax=Mytilus edulis TaxID=6550 RepID=UPI0039EE434E